MTTTTTTRDAYGARDILTPRFSRTKDARVVFYGEPGTCAANIELHFLALEARFEAIGRELATKRFFTTLAQTKIDMQRKLVHCTHLSCPLSSYTQTHPAQLKVVLTIWRELLAFQYTSVRAVPNLYALDKTGYCCQQADAKLNDELDTLCLLDRTTENTIPNWQRLIVPTFSETACSCPACAPDAAVIKVLRCLAVVVHTGLHPRLFDRVFAEIGADWDRAKITIPPRTDGRQFDMQICMPRNVQRMHIKKACF